MFIRVLILFAYFDDSPGFTLGRVFSVKLEGVLEILLELWQAGDYFESWARDFERERLWLYRSFRVFCLSLERFIWLPNNAFLFSLL